jgi:hypothetical protein
MIQIAHCCCGSLRADVTGEPAFVGACHCTECQRRTGSPFGVNTYFPTLSASPLARSPTGRCPGRRYPCGRRRGIPWVTFDHQLDRFTVQPEIDDLDLERPSHGAANARNDPS